MKNGERDSLTGIRHNISSPPSTIDPYRQYGSLPTTSMSDGIQNGIVYISPILTGPSKGLSRSASHIGISNERRIEQPCGKRFRHIFRVTAIILIGCVGAILNRIRGGFLSVPEPTLPDSASVIFRDVTSRLVVYAIPTGLLLAVLCRENKHADPYYRRRTILGLMAVLLTWVSLFVGWGTYMGIGRDHSGFLSRVGIFDWLIGHDCEDFNFGQRWSLEIVGMSLRGLVWTLPLGFLLFSFGYGSTFMYSGICMGVFYELGWELKSSIPNFSTGIELAELFWGFFLWIGLSASILAYRNKPIHTLKNTTRAKRFFFHLTLLLLELIFLGSCIGYSFVDQEDWVNKTQTLVGMCLITSFMILMHAFTFFSNCIYRTLRLSENSDRYWHFDESFQRQNQEISGMLFEGSINARNRRRLADRARNNVELVYEMILPHGKRPYRYVLALIRFLTVCTCLLIIPALIYDIAANRLHKTCDIPWKSM